MVIWLASGDGARIPESARRRIASGRPVVSPMVALELELLQEIGRITRAGSEVLDHLEATIGLTLSSVPFPSVVAPRDTSSGWPVATTWSSNRYRSARSCVG